MADDDALTLNNSDLVAYAQDRAVLTEGTFPAINQQFRLCQDETGRHFVLPSVPFEKTEGESRAAA